MVEAENKRESSLVFTFLTFRPQRSNSWRIHPFLRRWSHPCCLRQRNPVEEHACVRRVVTYSEPSKQDPQLDHWWHKWCLRLGFCWSSIAWSVSNTLLQFSPLCVWFVFMYSLCGLVSSSPALPCFLYWCSPAEGTRDGSRFCSASGNPGRVSFLRGLGPLPKRSPHLHARGKKYKLEDGCVFVSSTPCSQSLRADRWF